MKINNVDFDPREIQAVLIALDRMEADELDHAESIGEDAEDRADQQAREIYINEANVARGARRKFSDMIWPR